METPSEGETPPHVGDEKRDVSILSAIPSSGTEEVKGLKGLIKLQQSQTQGGGAVVNGHGEYTPPASQPSPPQLSQTPSAREMTPPAIVRKSTPQERRESPSYRRGSPVVVPDMPNEFVGRRVSSSSTVSSNTSTRVSSTRSIGRSSLRNLLASTSPPPPQQQRPAPIDIALEGVQRGLEALNVRKDPTKVRPTRQLY